METEFKYEQWVVNLNQSVSATEISNFPLDRIYYPDDILSVAIYHQDIVIESMISHAMESYLLPLPD